MKKKHVFLVFILLSIACSTINAQFDSKKLIFGGDIGFAISNDYWTVGVTPQIGYKLSNNFHAGVGIGYRYGKEDSSGYLYETDKDGNNVIVAGDYKQRENSVSFNLFANYYPWKVLIFSIKPEIIHTWYKIEFQDLYKYSTKKFVPAVTVGGGVYLKPVILQLNYELIQDDFSPYSDNVFLSAGVLF